MNVREMLRLSDLLEKAYQQTKDFNDRVAYEQAGQAVWNTFQAGLRVGQEPNTLADDEEDTP
jgi:hypothetical protein